MERLATRRAGLSDQSRLCPAARARAGRLAALDRGVHPAVVPAAVAELERAGELADVGAGDPVLPCVAAARGSVGWSRDPRPFGVGPPQSGQPLGPNPQPLTRPRRDTAQPIDEIPCLPSFMWRLSHAGSWSVRSPRSIRRAHGTSERPELAAAEARAAAHPNGDHAGGPHDSSVPL